MCRCTFGSPGIAPSSTSSMLGCAGGGDRDRVAVAAHALRDPEDVDLLHAGICVSAAMAISVAVVSSSSASTSSSSPPRSARRPGPPQRRARAAGSRAARSPSPQPRQRPAAGTSSHRSSRALERACPPPPARRRTPARRARPGAGGRPSPRPPSRAARRAWRSAIATMALGDRELVHQQILGSGSPTSWSITRRPPKRGLHQHHARAARSRTSPISAAALAARHARAARPAPRRRPPGATNATSLPSLATYIGSMPRISAAPATAGRDRHAGLAHEHRRRRRRARAR